MQPSQLIKHLFFSTPVRSLAEGALQTHHLNHEGRVEEDIHPGTRGRIYVDGVFWPAKCARPVFLMKGSRVRVCSYHNMELVVEPI